MGSRALKGEVDFSRPMLPSLLRGDVAAEVAAGAAVESAFGGGGGADDCGRYGEMYGAGAASCIQERSLVRAAAEPAQQQWQGSNVEAAQGRGQPASATASVGAEEALRRDQSCEAI